MAGVPIGVAAGAGIGAGTIGTAATLAPTIVAGGVFGGSGVATGGLFAAFGALSTTEIIGGGLTAASGIASIFAGRAEKDRAEFEAKNATIASQKEANEGTLAAIKALEEANQIEGQQIAGLAAAGITGEGTPEVTEARNRERGAFNVQIAKVGGASAAAVEALNAATIRSQGQAAQRGGFINALATGQSFATSLITRRT